jgi:hypothetical protein
MKSLGTALLLAGPALAHSGIVGIKVDGTTFVFLLLLELY